MSIFSWLRGKKSKGNETTEEIKDRMELGSFEQYIAGQSADTVAVTPESSIKKALAKRKKGPSSHRERMEYLKDNCEGVKENERQIEEAKLEYHAVTSYLTDMQRIDMIPLDERIGLDDAARKIINLTKERNKLQSKEAKITDQEYRLLERYEMQVPKEIAMMKENESFQSLINTDRKHLEKEKLSLLKEQKEVISKQSFLKWITIISGITLIAMFGVFSLLSSTLEVNVSIPFILTVIMAMVLVLYIFLEIKKNKYEYKMLDVKLNKLVLLMNKVKIKEVNNRNYLEYTYQKYNINSAKELQLMWEEFVRIKDENKRYQDNTQLLEFYNNELVQELKKVGIKDAEVWIYQPNAIIDQREMVEVRHRLNVRRQNLRDRIETNTKQREEALITIQSLIMEFPESQMEAIQLLNRYHIEL